MKREKDSVFIEFENKRRYAALLEKSGHYELVEYNTFGNYCHTPNDSHRNDQWYLNTINAFSAWNIATGSSDVIVAILDSGTDWMHPDLE